MIRDTLATFTTVPKTSAEVAARITSAPTQFHIAENKGIFVGFVTFGPFRPGPGYAATVEHTILIDPQAHGRGIGRALMAQAETAARAAGKKVMIGAISSHNRGAIRFHERLAYIQVGHLPGVGYKQGQWLDLILMQKNL
ncbi:phosphinothricin acetyltransferase [Roseobacter denitrificans OCh 114]|nr:phosphinothricin acetyltransferase [Roseobacter denitrificans OCh 114]